MEAKIQNISIDLLEINKGQLYGLPQNPRWIRDERFEALKKSIEDMPEMLTYRELLVYPLENEHFIIIGGNMRYRVCKEIGYHELPCKVLPKETPVAKLRELTIKDNESFGQNDWDILANEWDEEEITGWGMEIGDNWTDPDIDGEPGEDSEAKVLQPAEEDDFDEQTDTIPARAQLHDIWLLGDHRLMCGDSCSATDMAELMDGNPADLWLTDPPYNVAYGSADSPTGERRKNMGQNAKKILNDKMEDDAFRKFLVAAYSAAFDNMKPGAYFYIWHADTESYNFRGALRDVGQQLRQVLIWVKNALVMGYNDYHWKHEPCLIGWKAGASHHWYSDRCQTTCLEFDKPVKSPEHPTMKPIPLFAYLIQNSSQEGDIVLDSFGGSGTTLIACEQLNRKARLMELDPHYCDVIIARWEKLTGKEAVKAN